MDGRRCVRAALAEPALLPGGPVWVAAVGKAAASMAQGAREALGGRLAHTLVITRDADSCAALAGHPEVEVMIGGHPVPDERSLACGARLLEWTQALPAAACPLFLISGGASALAEVLVPGVGRADLRSFTQDALRSGVDIAGLNARRIALSQLKGGRLAAQLRGRPALALFISDVPGDAPALIGSGLMGPAPQGEDRVVRRVLAGIADAVAAVAEAGSALGLAVHAPPRRFDDGAVRLAARFAHELMLQPAQLCVWGGESTVTLPEHPGRGGRNQHLALAAARLLAGHAQLLLLAAGTDGSDGVTDSAGALVDADTCARIALAGLDADTCLAGADAARALSASGDLVHTGPTGTNVGDLVLGLKLTPAAAQALGPLRGGPAARML